MNITVDMWNYEQWQTCMALKLSQWRHSGIKFDIKPEQVELSATQPRDALRISRQKQNDQGGK